MPVFDTDFSRFVHYLEVFTHLRLINKQLTKMHNVTYVDTWHAAVFWKMDSARVARHNLHVHFWGVCSLEEVKALSSHTFSSTDPCKHGQRHLARKTFATKCRGLQQPDFCFAATTPCHKQKLDSALIVLAHYCNFTEKTR